MPPLPAPACKRLVARPSASSLVGGRVPRERLVARPSASSLVGGRASLPAVAAAPAPWNTGTVISHRISPLGIVHLPKGTPDPVMNESHGIPAPQPKRCACPLTSAFLPYPLFPPPVKREPLLPILFP